MTIFKQISKNRNGLTLIEIIIAIAILGIIAMSLLSALSTGFIQIHSMGNKTSAVAQAQEIIDTLYIGETPTGATQVITANLYASPSGNVARYAFDSITVEGKTSDTATVVVFYRGGSEYVTMSTVIP